MAGMASSWISNRNNSSHFWSINHPNACYQVSSQLAFGFSRRSEKKIFKMATMVAISRILAILIYKSPWCFLPSLESIGLSAQEMKWKIDFWRWWPWQPFWISDQHDFSYFWSTSHPDASYQVSSQLTFGFRKRSKKYIFKTAAMAAILDLRSARF